MTRILDRPQSECGRCEKTLSFDFSMAFQPIADVETREVFAYEALVRGPCDEPSGWVFARVNDENRYRFDQECRMRAIRLAARLEMSAFLSINFLPNAVYHPEACMRKTIEVSAEVGFPRDRLIFEVTEGERVVDHAHLISIIRSYREQGFRTAIDDFGAGYSGLNLLAGFQPDLIKLDMSLVRGIDRDRVRQAIARGILGVAEELDCEVIAEGIEAMEEMETLRELGIRLFQGFLLARPAFEALPEVNPAVFGD
jgi:EAL domain-containing protein (putative c-di-GMP-specific phosphodiesterase class I)